MVLVLWMSAHCVQTDSTLSLKNSHCPVPVIPSKLVFFYQLHQALTVTGECGSNVILTYVHVLGKLGDRFKNVVQHNNALNSHNFEIFCSRFNYFNWDRLQTLRMTDLWLNCVVFGYKKRTAFSFCSPEDSLLQNTECLAYQPSYFFIRLSSADCLACFYSINDWHIGVHGPQLIPPTCCVTAAGLLPARRRAALVCIHFPKACVHRPVCIMQSPAAVSAVHVWIDG